MAGVNMLCKVSCSTALHTPFQTLSSLHRFRTQTRFARWLQLCNAPSTVGSQRRAGDKEQVGQQQGPLHLQKIAKVPCSGRAGFRKPMVAPGQDDGHPV